MLVRSFTVNKIRGTRHQPLLHAIRNLFVFVAYCHLLELYVECAALYRIFIAHSFWNTRYGRPRGRTFHLTRSLVALEGWSLVRDRTNRKHCPSHENGRIRGMVAGEGGRSTGVLLYIEARRYRISKARLQVCYRPYMSILCVALSTCLCNYVWNIVCLFGGT